MKKDRLPHTNAASCLRHAHNRTRKIRRIYTKHNSFSFRNSYKRFFYKTARIKCKHFINKAGAREKHSQILGRLKTSFYLCPRLVLCKMAQYACRT